MKALRAMNTHAPIPRGLPALSALGLLRRGFSPTPNPIHATRGDSVAPPPPLTRPICQQGARKEVRCD